MISSERELSERYGLSRTTVRLALQELERMGLVVRQHGRGTFVADRSAQTTNLMQSYSFTDQMRSMGREPRTTILEFCDFEADKNLSEHMGVRLGEKLYKIKRLRSADGMPMMVERSYLPVRKFLTLKRPLLESMPLYDIIEKEYREKISVAEEEFFASIARPADAHLLGISEARPSWIWYALRTTRLTRSLSTRFPLLVQTNSSTKSCTAGESRVRRVPKWHGPVNRSTWPPPLCEGASCVPVAGPISHVLDARIEWSSNSVPICVKRMQFWLNWLQPHNQLIMKTTSKGVSRKRGIIHVREDFGGTPRDRRL